MAPVIAMETFTVKFANNEEFTEDPEKVSSSIFGKDFDIPKLKHHLAMLNDIIHQSLPEVKRITVKIAIYNLCGQRPPGLYDRNFVHGWFCTEKSL